jgi:hypothetical protein
MNRALQVGHVMSCADATLVGLSVLMIAWTLLTEITFDAEHRQRRSLYRRSFKTTPETFVSHFTAPIVLRLTIGIFAADPKMLCAGVAQNAASRAGNQGRERGGGAKPPTTKRGAGSRA